MVLAMAVLLFQFPAATALGNAARGPISANPPVFGVKTAAALPSIPSVPAMSPASRPSTAANAANARTVLLSRANSELGVSTKPSASRTSTGGNAAHSAMTASMKPPAPVQPSSPPLRDANAPAAEPIIYSFHPPTGSITQLTGPSFSEVILPPPPFRSPYELPATHRRLWLALSTAEHSAATYDAWSTRRALAAGRIEADPLMRPFAGSTALYPAIQLVPLGLDYLAHRLQRSSGWTHRIWWVPQSAATVTFLFSGSYNVAHTN